MKETTHRFFAPSTDQEQILFLTANLVRVTSLLEEFQRKIEYLEDALKETQGNQARMEQDIYRIQQKI